MPSYTTGEMAKLCNVSVRTVQFYDMKGILHPADLTDGGRRLYSEEDLCKLQLICTLRAIGLSLNSVKSVLESELSGKILTILLDEQVKLLTGEIGEREKQLKMINVIKNGIRDKAVVPASTIIGIESTMEKKNRPSNKKKLTMIYIGVGIASVLGLLLMAWLIASRIWWGFAVYISIAIFSLCVSSFHLRDKVFVCPNCNSVFKPSLRRTFFSTGDYNVRWMTCPECGHRDWCVSRKQKQIKETENNA